MKTWVISDTHFDHTNIIKYCSRPFKDTNHMNEHMIKMWSLTVAPEDLVYHIGDYAMSGGARFYALHGHRLPGRKILILGNHDKKASQMLNMGFDQVYKSLFIPVGDKLVFLNHRPLKDKPSYIEEGIKITADFVIHGHIHNHVPMCPSWNINVSVEVIEYTPVELEEIVKWQSKPK